MYSVLLLTLQGRCNQDPNARSITIMITDSCPECEPDHIDIQARLLCLPLSLLALVPYMSTAACEGPCWRAEGCQADETATQAHLWPAMTPSLHVNGIRLMGLALRPQLPPLDVKVYESMKLIIHEGSACRH